MEEKFFTAIMIFKNIETGEIRAEKYHKIDNRPRAIDRFTQFAKKKGANEFNLYGQKSRKFALKIKIGT